MHQFVFQVAEKAFRHCVVQTVSLPAHALNDSVLIERRPVGGARVLLSLVAVMNQARPRTTLGNRHMQCVEHQLLVNSVAHRPPHDTPGVEVDHYRHIEPPTTGRHKGDIRHPDPIGAVCREIPIEQIRCRRCAVPGGIGPAKAAYPFGEYPMHAPQPRHPMAAARLTHCPQCFPGLLLAIVLTGGPMDRSKNENMGSGLAK